MVRAHQTSLFQLCLAFLGDRHEAEDAAQGVFLKAYRSLASFRGGSAFRTWLTRIGINHCKDLLKKRRRRKVVSLDAFLETAQRMPESLVQVLPEEAHPRRKFPPEALGKLSRGERVVFERVVGNPEAGFDEIAKELGLSRDGVKGRLKRARVKIQTYLRKHVVQ